MSFRGFSYSLFGSFGMRYRRDAELGKSLSMAHMEMTPDAYVAWAATVWLIVSIVGMLVGLIVYAVVVPAIEEGNTQPGDEEPYQMDSTIKNLMVWGTGAGIPFFTFIYFKQIRIGEMTIKGNHPAMKAKQRGKKADLYLPHAASFVSAMSASNATMSKIFFALANQRAKKSGAEYYLAKITGGELEHDVFPIISEESAAVYRDMTLLGVDTLTAIQSAVDRAPSPWLAEFFQGIASTISSGGSLKLYFLNSAERFMEDIKQQQKETLDQLATQAEMFVTVAVAMPIFLIIILIITIWVSTSGSNTGDSLSTLYMVIFMLVPLLHFMFATMTYLNIKKFQNSRGTCMAEAKKVKKIKKIRTPSTGMAGMSTSDDLIPDDELMPDDSGGLESLDDLEEFESLDDLDNDLEEMFEDEPAKKEEPPVSAHDRELAAQQALASSSMSDREFQDLEGSSSRKKRKVRDPKSELIASLSVVIVTFILAGIIFGITYQDYKSDAATTFDADVAKSIREGRAWYFEHNHTVVNQNMSGSETGADASKAYKEATRMDGDWAREIQAGPITIKLNWVYYMVLGIVVITGPNGIIRRKNINKLKAKEAKFPDFIRDLAEFWKGGLSMKVAVDTLAKGDYGALDEEVEFMATQLSWGVSFNEVLDMFLQRVHTGLIERSIALIEEANKAGGKISDILLNVAHDAQEIKMLDREREGTMKSYIFVTFISFLIYVIIIVIMSYVFLPAIADSTADLDVEGGFGNVRIQSFEATFIALLFFSSVLIQSIGGGVNAGIMGEGNLGASLWYITLFVLTGAIIFQLTGVEMGLG